MESELTSSMPCLLADGATAVCIMPIWEYRHSNSFFARKAAREWARRAAGDPRQEEWRYQTYLHSVEQAPAGMFIND